MATKHYPITPTPVKDSLSIDSRIKVRYDDESFCVEVDGVYIGAAGSYWEGIDMGRSYIENISFSNNFKNTAIDGIRAVRHYSVYVIELNKRVLKDYKFVSANPHYDSSKPCVYVGMTGLSVEERFENHRNGYKSSKYVRKFGERLLPALYSWLQPMSYEEAKHLEGFLADLLRWQGYGVWQK